LIDNIAEQNNIQNVDRISLDQVLTIDMDSLQNAIETYQADSM
jgi:hypothetical protein